MPQGNRKSRSGPSGATLTEVRRRELGQERIVIRLPPPATGKRPWSERLATLCERADHSRADHLIGWILAEEAELEAMAARQRP